MEFCEISERCKGCEWYRNEVEQVQYKDKPLSKPFCIEYKLHIEWLLNGIMEHGRCLKYYPRQKPCKLITPKR